MNASTVAQKTNSRCVAMVHYHSAQDIQVVYRDPEAHAKADPELFARETRNYLEGPFNEFPTFTYGNVNVSSQEGLQTAMRVLEHGVTIPEVGQLYPYAWWMQDEEVAFVLTDTMCVNALTFSKLGLVCLALRLRKSLDKA